MNQPNSSNTGESRQPVAKRSFFLRILYRVYVNYLGVTPPTPAQEKTAAVVLVSAVVVGLAFVVVLVYFLWGFMAKMSAQ